MSSAHAITNTPDWSLLVMIFHPHIAIQAIQQLSTMILSAHTLPPSNAYDFTKLSYNTALIQIDGVVGYNTPHPW